MLPLAKFTMILNKHHFYIEAAPELGGRLCCLKFQNKDLIVPLTERSFQPTKWPKQGAYPLFPYHNRIENAQFEWQQKTITLATFPESEHTLHGTAHQKVWHGNISADTLTMILNSEPDKDWPWAYQATQSFRVIENTLHIELILKNLSNTPMPAGMGWHPYFCHFKNITCQPETKWPLNQELLPIPKPEALSKTVTLATGETYYLSGCQEITFDFNGKSGKLTTDRTLNHPVLHASPDGSYTCIEPTTHIPNALNLVHSEAALKHSLGTLSLSPGSKLVSSIKLTID
jgi:aldose 1-epimerase